MYGLVWAAFRFTRGALGERSVTDTRRCRYNSGNWHARQYVQSRSCSSLSTSHLSRHRRHWGSDRWGNGAPVPNRTTATERPARMRRTFRLGPCRKRISGVLAVRSRALDRLEEGARAWVARDAASCIRGHVALHGVGDGAGSDLWTDASGFGPERMLALNRLFVSPAYRRQRLGEVLMTVATRHAHDHGAQPVLNVAQDSVAAVRLYERQGWRRVGEWELALDGQTRLPLFAFLGPAATRQPCHRTQTCCPR